MTSETISAAFAANPVTPISGVLIPAQDSSGLPGAIDVVHLLSSGGSSGLIAPTLPVPLGDESTVVSASTSVAKLTFPAPADWTGISVAGWLNVAQASGATLVTFDVKVNGTSMFSTRPTIDNTEQTTATAATPAVQTITSWTKGDKVECFLYAAQASSVAAGPKLTFTAGSVTGTVAGVPMLSAVGDGATAINSANTSLTDIANFAASLLMPAKVGDVLELEFTAAAYGTGICAVFIGFNVAGTDYTASPFDLSVAGNTFSVSPRLRHVVTAGDLSSGAVAVRPRYKVNTSAVNLVNGANGVPVFTVKNYGDGSGLAANGAPVVFRAHCSTNKTVTTGSFVKAPIDAKDFDSSSAYDATTNYRLQPTAAGYYNLYGQITATGTPGIFIAAIYKNGASIARGNDVRASPTSSTVYDLVYLNGSTDYAELWCYVGSGGGLVGGVVDQTYFGGSLQR